MSETRQRITYPVARRRRALARVAVLFLVVSSSASAQSPDRTQASANTGSPTRLGELYTQVQRDNPRVAAAQALVRAALARVPGARRLPDPQLQLGFMNYELPGLVPMDVIGMTQLQVMQMVPLGGKLGLAGRVAGAQASATRERAQEVVWELRTQTAMAFYDLYATDEQFRVARETLRLLQDIARTTEAMYRVGEGRQTDVLRAQVEIARMAGDTARMLAMRQTMVARLNALRDGDATTTIAKLVRPLYPEALPAEAWLDSLAAGGRPMIRAGIEALRGADASAALARREIIPDLQIGVQYGQQKATMPGTDALGAAMPTRSTERMGSLMIGVTLPIYARDRQFQMRNEADAMRTMAGADLAAMRAETRGRIGEAYARLVQARSLAHLYRTTVLPQAEASVASAMSAYRVASIDFMTLLDNRMTVNKYRQELYTLEADEGKAWAELEMLTGRQLIDPNNITVADTQRQRAQPASRGPQ